MIRVAALSAGIALISMTSACTLVSPEAEDIPERPRDVEGTWATAAPLMLAACAHVHRDESRLDVALTPDGGCTASATHVETCRRYTSIELTINGRSFPATSTGGWATAPAPNARGELAFGCSFPRFEIVSRDLFTETGTADVSMTIAGERHDFRVEHWLLKRTIEVPAGSFVSGSDASVVVGPRYEGLMGDRDSVRLVSEDLEIQQTWIDVRWEGDRIVLPLLERMPAGEAELELEERRIAVIVGCPFSMCGAMVDRSTRTNVVVTAPAE